MLPNSGHHHSSQQIFNESIIQTQLIEEDPKALCVVRSIYEENASIDLICEIKQALSFNFHHTDEVIMTNEFHANISHLAH